MGSRPKLPLLIRGGDHLGSPDKILSQCLRWFDMYLQWFRGLHCGLSSPGLMVRFPPQVWVFMFSPQCKDIQIRPTRTGVPSIHRIRWMDKWTFWVKVMIFFFFFSWKFIFAGWLMVKCPERDMEYLEVLLFVQTLECPLTALSFCCRVIL